MRAKEYQQHYLSLQFMLFGNVNSCDGVSKDSGEIKDLINTMASIIDVESSCVKEQCSCYLRTTRI